VSIAFGSSSQNVSLPNFPKIELIVIFKPSALILFLDFFASMRSAVIFFKISTMDA